MAHATTTLKIAVVVHQEVIETKRLHLATDQLERARITTKLGLRVHRPQLDTTHALRSPQCTQRNTSSGRPSSHAAILPAEMRASSAMAVSE